MISYLTDLMQTTLMEYLELVFTAVSAPLGVLLKSVALIAVLFVALNHIMQFRPVNYSVYLMWGMRYMLIYTFALVWENFNGIYTLITEIPDHYAALLVKAVAGNFAAVTHRTDILDPGRITDQYTAMDEFSHALFWMAGDFFRDTSITNLGLTFKNIGLGILMGIIGGIWTAVATIIVMIAQIGFMMALSLAPLAICMLMMEQTRQYFEAWSRFVLSFLVIPLLLAALTSIVLFFASSLLVESNAGSNNKEAYLMFACVMVAAFVLLWKLPEMGQTISGSAIGAAGVGLGRAAASFAAKGGPGMAFRGAQRIRDGAQVANAARKAGASPGRVMWSTLNGMRQSAIARQNRRDDRLSGRTRGLGGSGGGGGGGSGDGGSSSSPQSPLPSPGSRVGLAGRVLRDGFRAAMAVREAGGSRGKMLRAALGGMGKSASVRRARRTEILEARKARAAESGGRAPRRKNSRGTSPEDYEN
ncbi:hypothetical protein GR138_27635 [Shinella kummerowiae]|jgi:type IV secretory pathway VirB6-like protein|uniref:Type IV secretion system protein n=1 Tax=Shinella kummerowiae TaxID=417745 RepID=A0A6N8SMD5_9HYPH|nr:type IV secretion system protein [Shinella kummerowiae]MXN48978.1 hypothetical protein [Shinella kummerowiae]